jgi:hypothetical protein
MSLGRMSINSSPRAGWSTKIPTKDGTVFSSRLFPVDLSTHITVWIGFSDLYWQEYQLDGMTLFGTSISN